MSKQATKIQEGATVDYTAAATIANGDVIPAVTRCVIALDDAVSGDTISVALEGVFEVTAATADTVLFGTQLYWDVADANATTDADTGTNIALGSATTAKAGAAAGTVNVKIG